MPLKKITFFAASFRLRMSKIARLGFQTLMKSGTKIDTLSDPGWFYTTLIIPWL